MSDYQSEIAPMVAGYDLEWLINQLSKWPTRVDESRTTSMRYLMDAAAVTLRALAETASQAPIEDAAGVTEFNVNEYVWVQLTETGLAMHKADHAKYNGLLGEYQLPKTDADGWHRIQLWDLMHTYGSGCYNGARVPFKTTIRLAPPPPSTGEREPPVKEV